MACNKRIRLKIVALLLFATGLVMLSISQIIYVEEKPVASSVSCEESFKVKILDVLAGVCILMSFVVNLVGSFAAGDSSQKLIFRRKIHDAITHSNKLASQDKRAEAIMDLTTGLIKTNICGAMVFALYFYMQTCGGWLQMLSFLVAVPMAKVVMDRMTIPVRIANGHGYPVKELAMNFLKFNYGVWSILLVEATRRVVIGGLFGGIVSILLMLTMLLAFVFSEATGVCYTNVKNYQKGTLAFCAVQWILISVSFLMGSSWVLTHSNQGY